MQRLRGAELGVNRCGHDAEVNGKVGKRRMWMMAGCDTRACGEEERFIHVDVANSEGPETGETRPGLRLSGFLEIC